MKIKDIRAFRTWLKNETGNTDKDENFIGFSHPYGTDSREETKHRGFFNVYHNQAPQIEARLSTVLDMAQDSQAIYEFVQNAVDCDSTAFFMFYDQEHFLAINNGTPFDQKGVRAILNFAQSTKTNDENIGKFGVGFKLIHRMVGVGNGLEELTHDYVGPIVFSWSAPGQLAGLLETATVSGLEPDPDARWDHSDAAWFFKILLTCVPVLPSELDAPLRDTQYEVNDGLFSAEEFNTFQGFLRTIWAEHQDKFTAEDMRQGSIFYLRLGEEKSAKLDEDFSYFKKGIQYSLSFVGNLMKKKGLQRIYFNSEVVIEKDKGDILLEPALVIPVKSPDFEEIKPRLKENDRSRPISAIFGFQPFENTAKYGELRNTPNFYKFFPMGKEVSGLNFVIHSNIFEIDASRREFVQGDERNKFLLRKLAANLETALDAYQEADPARYAAIFLAILFSNDPVRKNNDWAWISKALYEPLTSYISTNCPSADGSYRTADELVMKDTALAIDPLDFGIVNKHWFKWQKIDFSELLGTDGKKDNSYEKLVGKNWDIAELVREGNPALVNTWLTTAPEAAKTLFYAELDGRWANLSDAKLWGKIVAIDGLVDLAIASSDLRVKQNYIKHIPALQLDSRQAYQEEDPETKLLALAFDTLKSEDEKEAFRGKVSVLDEAGDSHRLLEVREDDRIHFKDHTPNSTLTWQMNLSEVLPKYKNKSGILHQVIASFERIELKLHTFLGVRKPKSNPDIYRLLQKDHQQLDGAAQFVFLAFYSTEQKSDHLRFFDRSLIRTGEVLTIYHTKNYPFPAQWSTYLDEFNPRLSVFPDQWASSSELLPVSVKSWLAGDTSKQQFLTAAGVNFESSPVVKIRSAIAGAGEVTQNHFDLVKEKSPSLLLHTLTWLAANKTVLTHPDQVTALGRLLATNYLQADYQTSHPQVLVDTVLPDGQVHYRIAAYVPENYLLTASLIGDLATLQIPLYELYQAVRQQSVTFLEARQYPERSQKKMDLTEPELIDAPEFERLYEQAYSFDLPFFEEWQDTHQVKVRLTDGQMPWAVTFGDQCLRRYQKDNFAKDPARAVIYLNVNPALDNADKAELLVAIIGELPVEMLSYPAKQALSFAYEQWKIGEQPDISALRKRRLAEAAAYSFEWLKAMFDWEYDANPGNGRSLRLAFERLSLSGEDLLLAACNYETIPAKVEFHTEPIQLRLRKKNDTRYLACQLLKYSEFELILRVGSAKNRAFLQQHQTLDKFTASFSLPGDDVLMHTLRDRLFGVNALAPKNGSIREYLTSQIAERDLSFLFGPPGTGKTTKLAIDILLTLSEPARPHRILVLTPTNKAADVVLERVLQLLSDPDSLKHSAATYYPQDSVERLSRFSSELYRSGKYREMLIRYGASASELLLSQGVVQDRSQSPTIAERFVLVTTVHRLPFDQFQELPLRSAETGWTHVVVDESSMVSLPHALFVLLQLKALPSAANQSGLLSTFTFSGDPFQIQPVGQTPNYIEQGQEKLKGWGTENIYTLLELDNFALNRTRTGNYYVKKLMVQYRSVPAIGELFSRYKYDGKIKHHKGPERNAIQLGDHRFSPVNFVQFPVLDTGTFPDEDIYTIQKYGAYSAYHIYSIVLACEMASAFKLQYPEKSVGIITPYSTQARLAKEIARAFQVRNPADHFEVSTVHRYQGDENDIILLLMNPPKVHTYEFSHFNNPFLVNVGISRAKECLLVLHPGNVTGYSEIAEVIKPLAGSAQDIPHLRAEQLIFPKLAGKSRSQIEELVEVNAFQSFNVADLLDFRAAAKEYLFFADNRDIGPDERRCANVIVDISKRKPLTEYLEPKIGMTVTGMVDAIHANGKTAFIKLDRIKARGVIHNNAVSREFISDINQILSIGQPMKAKIKEINDKGIVLSMIGVPQDPAHQ